MRKKAPVPKGREIPTEQELQQWEDILNGKGLCCGYPETHPERAKYEKLIRELRARLAAPGK